MKCNWCDFCRADEPMQNPITQFNHWVSIVARGLSRRMRCSHIGHWADYTRLLYDEAMLGDNQHWVGSVQSDGVWWDPSIGTLRGRILITLMFAMVCAMGILIQFCVTALASNAALFLARRLQERKYVISASHLISIKQDNLRPNGDRRSDSDSNIRMPHQPPPPLPQPNEKKWRR